MGAVAAAAWAPTALPAHLAFMADTMLHTHRLRTGFAREVSGSLVVRRALPSAGAAASWHYALADTAVRFFAPGTASAVL